jgi:hypothetical protein
VTLEITLRRHHLNARSRQQVFGGPVGKSTTGNTLDGHAQTLVLHGRADGVRAAQLLAVNGGAQRQVLALRIRKRLVQMLRHVEAHGHRVPCDGLDLADAE